MFDFLVKPRLFEYFLHDDVLDGGDDVLDERGVSGRGVEGEDLPVRVLVLAQELLVLYVVPPV